MVFGIMVFGMMVWWYDVINFQVTPINPLRLGAHRISSIGWYIGKLEKISNFVKKVAEHQKSIQEKQFENEKDGKYKRRKRQIRSYSSSFLLHNPHDKFCWYLQSVQIKRLEEHWISLPCAFESFVPADELLLNFQVAAFNLFNKK